MPRRARRVTLRTFEKSTKLGKTTRLVVGVDYDNPHAQNVICYIRTEYENEYGKTKGGEVWLSRQEFQELGMLLVAMSAFWKETWRKDNDGARHRVKQFKQTWNSLRTCLWQAGESDCA